MRMTFLVGSWLSAAAVVGATLLGGCSDAAGGRTAEQSGAVGARRATPDILKDLGGTPCGHDSAFTCVKISVPLDHASTGPEAKRIDVQFGVRPASGERRGVFVVLHGGPGGSGIDRLDDYHDLDAKIPQQFDVVHFDMRGISVGFECPRATAARRTASPGIADDDDAAIARARTFAEDCVREMNVPSADLPFYSTRQAVEDLEDFRKVLEEDKLYLYGMSYGTQFGQTYAAAHPDHTAALVIDGVVDLTLTLAGYEASVAARQNAMLEQLFEACRNDTACAAATANDPAGKYDALAARLAEGSLPFDYPNGDATEHRQFTRADLDAATDGSLGDAADRRKLLRALGGYVADGNLRRWADMLYSTWSVDGGDLQAHSRSSSDGTYFLITCNDYTMAAEEGTTDALATARAHLARRRPDGRRTQRLDGAYLADLPCAFWPRGEQNPNRPAALVATGVPVVVVGAKGDAITPYNQGIDVSGRLADGYSITYEGGEHVTLARHRTCIDAPVAALLLRGTKPAERAITCEGPFVDAY